ncbi:hypothetical protein [Streptomyces sp. NPDC008001]|uniref:hypothetical protein n=1 Tax=Streptomyces sp. NPDC008001 TaxID=3364804 RepID=UPI0036E7BCB7
MTRTASMDCQRATLSPGKDDRGGRADDRDDAKAYKYQYVFCRYGSRIGSVPVGLDASHVRW